MKIAQVSTIDGRLTGGNSMRISGLSRGLSELGHSVVVVCASGSEFLEGQYERHNSPLLKLYGPRFLIGRPSFASLHVGKIARYLLAPFSRRFLSHIDSCSILHCHQHWAASLLEMRGRKEGQKLLFDYHDPILLTNTEGGAFGDSNTPLRLRIAKWERDIFEQADMVSFVSPILRDRISKISDIDIKKTCVIPDGADVGFISSGWKKIDVDRLRHLWKANRRIVVMYIGSLGTFHGGSYLKEAISDILRDGTARCDYKFVIIGMGSMAENFVRLQKRYPDALSYISSIPYSLLPAYLASADILLVPHPRNLLLDSIESGKLITYLASGKPTVVTRLTATQRFLENGVNSALCDPTSSSSMVDQIEMLASSSELRRKIGENGAKLVRDRNLDWGSIAEETIDVYRRLLSCRPVS